MSTTVGKYFFQVLDEEAKNIDKEKVTTTDNPGGKILWIDCTERGDNMTERKYSDFSKAKIGDKVYSISYGWGVITKCSGSVTSFPIEVKFPKKECDGCHYDSYTLTGQADYEGPCCLFHDEIFIDPPPPPRRVVKIKAYIRGGNFFDPTTKNLLLLSGPEQEIEVWED